MKKVEVTKEVFSKVSKYVEANYNNFVGKVLMVKESDSAILIYKHEHGGPLVLSKEILA